MLYGLKTGLEPFLFFMPAILVISAKNASRDCPFGTAPAAGLVNSWVESTLAIRVGGMDRLTDGVQIGHVGRTHGAHRQTGYQHDPVAVLHLT